MKSPARLGFFLVACLIAMVSVRADDAPPQLIPSIPLRDGRVLHNVKIMASEDDSIVVHADEGLLKVMRSNLPASFGAPVPQKSPDTSASGLVMESFNPNQAELRPPEARPAPKVNPALKVPVPPKIPVVNPVFKGCTITSFQMKAFQTVLGCAEVVVRNDSDVVVVLLPRDIVCVTSKGQRRGGRNFVTDGFPPQIRKREILPPQSQIDELVTFTDEALDISSVQWTK